MILPCLLLVLLGFAYSARAQTIGVDLTGWGPMDGFELYGNGIYWWNDGTIPDEIIPARTGQVAIRSLIAGSGLVTSSSRPHFVAQSTELRARFQSAARNDDWMFYFSGPNGSIRIKKKGNFGPDPILNDFSGSFFHEGGAILLAGSTVYWAARGGHAADSGEVRWKDINGPPGGGDVILKQGMGLVRKMKIVPLVEESGSTFNYYLLLLNTSGQLWHVRLPGLFDPTTGPLTLYASDVTDFDSRAENELVFQGGLFRRVHGTRLYIASGFSTANNRPSGKLLSFNFTSGGITTEYDTGHPNFQITSVTVDSERLFITQTPLVQNPSGVWMWNLPGSSLLRKAAPLTRGIVFTNFGVIASQVEGRNLRSDTNWLYFAHLNEIRKVKTDAPDMRLDYKAIGLEVVQTVQDFNNSVSLVAGKPTLVRGYAQILANTTSKSRHRMTARLRGFRDGVPFADQVDAYSYPTNYTAGDLPTLRTNLQRAFLFDLPPHWVSQPGALRLELLINADGTAPEVGDGVFGNNVAATTVNIAPARVPNLVFKVMSSTMGNYDRNAAGSGFWDIVDRAATLMPVTEFSVHFSEGVVQKPVFPVTREPFSMPDDDNWALLWMTVARSFGRDPGPDTHWVGMFPPNVGDWNGIGGARGVSLQDLIPESPFNIKFPRTELDSTSVIRMTTQMGSAGAAWTSIRGGHTLAHELGHNYGRFHIDQTRSMNGCGGSAPDRPFHFMPFGIDACALGVTDLNNFAAPVGYDFRTDTLVGPNMAADLMTYGNSRWMSPFTWNALLGVIPAPAQGQGFAPASEGNSGMLNPQPLPPGGIVLAQGIINPATRGVAVLPALQLPNGILDDTKMQESLGAIALPSSMPFKLRLLDPNGTLLDERAIVPLPSSEYGGQFAFVQAVPNLPGASRLQVLEGSTVLNETRTSQNAPFLILQMPVVNAPAETLSLRWTASDADDDPLLFSVQFSSNDGASWESLSIHDPALALTVSTRSIRGGTACRLRVIATDGFRTTTVMTGPFFVPKHAPSIAFTGVRDQQQIPFNSNVLVRVFAHDPEDGTIASEAISWSISGPENRSGRGGRFSLQGLAPGQYLLIASAPDLDGNTGWGTNSFQTRPIEVLDGPMPEVDGICEDSYAQTTEVRLFPGRAAPAARLVHSAGSLYVCFDGLPYADLESNPADINFYIDGDGVATGSPQASDVGFGVTEDGIPARARGTGSGWASEQPQGFEVKILRSTFSWGAEFRVPDSLIGGWNHASAITFLYGPGFGSPVRWPATANVFNPSTWSALSLGPLQTVTNRPPVAVASGPAVVSYTGTDTVSLDGSGSYDLDGNALSFSWSQMGGPSVSLANASSASPTFNTPALSSSATLMFQLIVNDGVVNSAPKQIAVVLSPTATSFPAGDTAKPIVVNVGNGSAKVQLHWPGTPGSAAIIQASSNLVNWVNVATNNANYLGTLLFSDLQAGQHPRRFYRAVDFAEPERPLTRAQLSFDGVNDWVGAPHATALNSLPLTITAWIRTSQAVGSVAGIITKAHTDDLSGYGIGLAEGRLTCWYTLEFFRFIVVEGTGPGMPFVADGQWHHVAFVVDTTGGRVFLDGSLVVSTPWEGSPGAVTTTEPIRFGFYPGEGGGFYNGDLDEAALWNRALTADEINQRIPGQLAGTELGLLGCWKLNDGAGFVASDSSPAARHGTLFDGTLWTESTAPLLPNLAAGTALRFDGTNQSVVVVHHASLNAFPLAITAWVKTAQNSAGYVAIANKYAPGSGNGYSLHIHQGRVAAFYFAGTGFVYHGDPGLDGGFIADGRWHHVAYVVDANGARIYLDGVQMGTLGWTGTPGAPSTTTPLTFARYPLASQTISLDGRIDELTIWNRALDASEVNGVMNNKQASNAAGLLGYWPFDNGSGTTASDVTGHGHSGSLQFNPLWLPSDAPIAP